MSTAYDIVIVGSGIGGSTMAAGLARSGARIGIIERGGFLEDSPMARSDKAIFLENKFRPKEFWYDTAGNKFNPGMYYFVGGNSKLYGAALPRFRERDFGVLEHFDGISPAWPYPYETLEPWYCAAEKLFQVRAATGEDPTEPPRSAPYLHPPIPDEPSIRRARGRLSAIGARVYTQPLAVDLDRWLARAPTPWDAFPDTRCGKIDAEAGPLATALANGSIDIMTNTYAERLVTAADGRRIEGIDVVSHGERKTITAGTFIVSAGAINSAALLLRSANDVCPQGVANRSGVVGRYFMNHNCTAMLTIDFGERNDAVYQKTLAINDFYFGSDKDPYPLGNIQLMGKVSGNILKANLPGIVPKWPLDYLAGRSLDWYLMSEDIPSENNRITVDGDRITLHWVPTNMEAHHRLVKRSRELFRKAGYQLILTKEFDRRTPSHQCGTVRMGSDPSQSALDEFCRSHDHSNLFVVDGGFLPSSAAMNPSLTIAAQALRTADHLSRTL